MPNENEQVADAGTAVGTGPQGEESGKETTLETGKQTDGTEKKTPSDDSAGVVEEVELEGLEQLEDKSFVLKVGSSTYKGKTQAELLKNIRKGLEDKDTFISKLRAKELTDVASVTSTKKIVDGQPEDGIEVPELPSEEDVYASEIQRSLRRHSGLKPEMLRWSEDQWDAYSETDGVKSWRVAELRQAAREVLSSAADRTNQRMDEASTVALNADIIKRETKKVQRQLEESGLSDDALKTFDYTAILERAIKNTNKAGVIDSGAIVHEAALEIQKMLRDERKSPVSAKLTEDLILGKKKIALTPAAGGGGGAQRTTKEMKPTGDWDKALDRALADIAKS